MKRNYERISEKEEAAAEDISLPEITPDEQDKEHHHAKGIST